MNKIVAAILILSVLACGIPTVSLADPLYTSMDMNEEISIEGALWIAGVAEENLYVILTTVGQTAYAPMEWFGEGNG